MRALNKNNRNGEHTHMQHYLNTILTQPHTYPKLYRANLSQFATLIQRYQDLAEHHDLLDYLETKI